MTRFERMERLYNRLNGMAIRAYNRGDVARGKRVDRAMSMLESLAFSEGCRAEWVVGDEVFP